MGTGAVLGGAAVASGISLVALAYGGVFAWSWINSLKNPTLTRVPVSSGREAEIKRGDLRYVRLVPDSQLGWKVGTGLGELHKGAEALLTLTLLLPHINRRGGAKSAQQEALRYLEDRGHPDRVIEDMAKQSHGFPICSLKPPERFALEMAVNEGAERQLMEAELRLLAKAWKEAEEIAAIADSLLVPPSLEKRIADLKSRRVGRSEGSAREGVSHGV